MAGPVQPITQRWVADRLPPRPSDSHKTTFGRILIIAGSLEYPGAAILTALGAMRGGAGLVRLAAAESVAARLAGSAPEITWLGLDEEAPGLIGPGGWRRIEAESGSYDSIVIGPGLGQQPTTQRRTRNVLATFARPTVVDADALNALAGGARWWQSNRAPLVLTPHPGEFARLTGADVPADDASRADAAADAAVRWNEVVVLKGARTVVAAPDGTLMRSDVATPALATAGSGDVLAGLVGALLAAGCDPITAAACGVAVHGAAGLLAEGRIGRAGVLARDIASLLPEAMEQLRGARPS